MVMVTPGAPVLQGVATKTNNIATHTVELIVLATLARHTITRQKDTYQKRPYIIVKLEATVTVEPVILDGGERRRRLILIIK